MTQPVNVCDDPRCMCSCHETPGAKNTAPRPSHDSFISMPRPVPKPSATKKTRGRKGAAVEDES